MGVLACWGVGGRGQSVNGRGGEPVSQAVRQSTHVSSAEGLKSSTTSGMMRAALSCVRMAVLLAASSAWEGRKGEMGEGVVRRCVCVCVNVLPVEHASEHTHQDAVGSRKAPLKAKHLPRRQGLRWQGDGYVCVCVVCVCVWGGGGSVVRHSVKKEGIGFTEGWTGPFQNTVN